MINSKYALDGLSSALGIATGDAMAPVGSVCVLGFALGIGLGI